MDSVKRDYGTTKISKVPWIEIGRRLVQRTLEWKIRNTTNCWSIYRGAERRRKGIWNGQSSLLRKEDKYIRRIRD